MLSHEYKYPVTTQVVRNILDGRRGLSIVIPTKVHVAQV